MREYDVPHSHGMHVVHDGSRQAPPLLLIHGSGASAGSWSPSLDALLPQPFLLRILLARPLGPILWSMRSEAMIRKRISATAARPVDVPDDLVADLRGITFRAFTMVLRRNTAYITERSVPERLAALDVPVLVIFGAADPRWEPSSALQYNAVPNARVELLPGIGHLPMFEAPEATNTLLLGFAATGADTPAAIPDA